MKLTGEMLWEIGHHYELGTPVKTERKKVSGMRFDIQAYRVPGLGWVSAMTAVGFFGLMKMDTLIINPLDVDMPLFSYDRVLAMGNDTLIFELYDTLLGEAPLDGVAAVKGKYKSLPDHDLGEHWYDGIKLAVSLAKKGKKAHTSAFDACALAYLKAFLSDAKKATPCEKKPKQAKASVYVEGLLSNGGPSTDVFKKGIGAEATAQLFRETLFGTRD